MDGSRLEQSQHKLAPFTCECSGQADVSNAGEQGPQATGAWSVPEEAEQESTVVVVT